jgi:hypothetical protein
MIAELPDMHLVAAIIAFLSPAFAFFHQGQHDEQQLLQQGDGLWRPLAERHTARRL